ncbi:GIY-YIG nuclease family protein [Bifidobacterium castoris]|uniref:Bacteriophage T5 Orf172 DNA-binding domain-containing protein n=1 Tax=Bifidobacterium castoris TaxID=2306972 RepID=A0A430FAM4_9BIFI|nr:GIY-YIG nuclease family protein [Bifidobacterium castoris]RSX49869.1 hypothetical protein D2E22_0330 [Bifidobacterium castoris]
MSCIYILTNPSFPEWVKIGYATNVDERVGQLNASTAVPFAFRIYATYDVSRSNVDKRLHHLIDALNPDLRSIDEVHGHSRRREFYAMDAEDAYRLLEDIATITDTTDRLHRFEADAEQREDEQEAEEARTRRTPFRFDMVGLTAGETITFIHDESIQIVIADNAHVEYEGDLWTLSALARTLVGTSSPLQGPAYFTYGGETLKHMRVRYEHDPSLLEDTARTPGTVGA